MRRGLLLATLAVVLAAAPAARAEDPPFVGWASLLPSMAKGFTPSTFDACADGAPSCVGRTIARMGERLARLDARCDHRALFLRNYLTVTQHYAQLPQGFFADDRFLAHEDAVFAQLYFDAFDAHARKRFDEVPEAWRLAFDAARGRQVEGLGDLLLGINAHVQRDMPFMLAGLGLLGPDGRSRKDDHDRFNTVLNASFDDVYGRATAVDDPRMALYNPYGPLSGALGFQLVAGWREGVWRNAERLARARTRAARQRVARSIERQAAASAQAILAFFAYRPPASSVEARRAHCRSRPADPGPGGPPAGLDGRALVRAGDGQVRRP
ncbi:MAG TPA: DUF5995 family protein [Baekduia sp.]|nr:DUF5995 family protein [Baekduia sp.]